jgi:uncharacterized protein (DUF433 family)
MHNESANWPAEVAAPMEAWFEQNSRRALTAMADCVDCQPNRLGGVPVLRNSRLSVSQIITELADSDAIAEIADNFDVDEERLRRFVHALAIYFNQPLK